MNSLNIRCFFLTVGASIVHLAAYHIHAVSRLEYSIILSWATGAQLFYGIMYILLIFSEDKLSVKQGNKNFFSKGYYKKITVSNLVWMVDLYFSSSCIKTLLLFHLLCLPIQYPEDVDLAGVINKSLEVVLVIGIVYLMKTEKKSYRNSVKKFA